MKASLSLKTILLGGIGNSLQVKKMVEKMPASSHLKNREIKEIFTDGFVEERTMKNDTLVIRHYRIDKNNNGKNARLIQKNVFPGKNKNRLTTDGELEYITRYSNSGKFLATLKCESKKSSYITFFKDLISGKIESAKGIGAFNRSTKNKNV